MSVSVNPIRNDNDLEIACGRLRVIFHAEDGSPEGDERAVLSALIETYERIHIPMGSEITAPTFAEYVKKWGLTQGELTPIFKSRGRVSDVMSGRRTLSLAMVKALHETFGMPYDRLVPFALESHAKAS